MKTSGSFFILLQIISIIAFVECSPVFGETRAPSTRKPGTSRSAKWYQLQRKNHKEGITPKDKSKPNVVITEPINFKKVVQQLTGKNSKAVQVLSSDSEGGSPQNSPPRQDHSSYQGGYEHDSSLLVDGYDYGQHSSQPAYNYGQSSTYHQESQPAADHYNYGHGVPQQHQELPEDLQHWHSVYQEANRMSNEHHTPTNHQGSYDHYASHQTPPQQHQQYQGGGSIYGLQGHNDDDYHFGSLNPYGGGGSGSGY